MNQDNVNDIFNGEGYTLGEAVTAGDVLDFQGTIDLGEETSHSLVINKKVNIVSSTQDAVLKLYTPAGDRTGNNPGNTFVINTDGAGTTVQDIRLENTGMWIYNTSDVTFTGVTFYVKDANVCSGVGHVSVRYSNNITFDGCTIYTENNGASSACVLTISNNCTFKDSRFECVGIAGNPLYIGNPYNTGDKPDGITGTASDDCTVTGCTITGINSALCRLQVMGLRHRIENCTVDVGTGLSGNATTAADGYIIRNNTFTQGLTVPNYSTAENNTVTGNLSVNKGATVTGNSVIGNVNSSALDITFTNNNVLGKLTHSQKNAKITGNTIISTEEYAVYVSSTANDANNTVTGNVLIAAAKAGDEAVNSRSESNTVSNNLSQAPAGDVTWNYDAATGTLTISGTGAMANYEQITDGKTTAPWAFLSDQITRVVIADGVTAIGDNAFYGCAAVTSVFAKGDNAPSLGSNAFDANATFGIYVPTGKGADYQQTWTAYAGSISEYLSCGDNAMAIYDATTHTLTICGTGDMFGFASAADQPWASLQGELQNVVFEGTITAIGTNAFAGCSALTAVNIEDTKTTIAEGAFDGNADGRRIFVPVAAIGSYSESTYAADIYSTGFCGAEGSEESIAWELNAATKSLNISGTGDMADFASTSSVPWTSARTMITSATIGSGVTTIGYGAFSGCTGMATVSIPNTVTSIGSYAFSGCSILTAIDIPADVTTIGDHAFTGCLGLTTIDIPSGVTSITNGCFRDCSSLTTVSIPSNVTSISDYAFYGCSSLATIDIPDGVTTIGKYAFSGCTSLTTIVIPEGVTTLSDYLFDDCTSLTAIDIPANVTEIGSSAFRSCGKLASVTIPATVTSVGNYCFRDCGTLAEVYIFAPSLQTYGTSAFQDTPSGLKIYVSANAVDTYKAGWSKYADNIVGIEAIIVSDETETAYALLKEAFLAVQDGETIKLNANVTITNATDLMTGQRATEDPVKFTIDFNGYIIDGTEISSTCMNTEHEGDEITFIDSSEGQTGGLKGVVSGKPNSFVFAGGRYSYNGCTAADIKEMWTTALVPFGWKMADGMEFVDMEDAPDANGFYVRVAFKTYELTIGAGLFTTFYADSNIKLDEATDEGVGLYSIKSIDTDNGTATLSEAITGTILAGTPLLVYNGSDQEQTVKIQATNEASTVSLMWSSHFQGTAESREFTAADMDAADYYALSAGKAFVKVKGEGTLSANQCWLQFDKEVVGARALTIVFDGGETTGINSMVNGQRSMDTIYDLSGRKITKLTTKGVFIVNGKKVVK